MSQRVAIGSIDDFPAGQLTKTAANGTILVVAHLADGRLCAVHNQCSHMPLPLHGGKLDGDVLTCPWHNSECNVCTGENLDWVRGVAGIKLPGWTRRVLALGKKPAGLTTVPVEVVDGQVYVEV